VDLQNAKNCDHPQRSASAQMKNSPATGDLLHDLISALYKLKNQFADDAEMLHLAVSIVFSAIFNAHGISCIIVGGQSAAYWMRVPGSTDVDFVSSDIQKVTSALMQCGFSQSSDFLFRFIHSDPDVLVEIVGENIDAAGMKSEGSVNIEPNDVEDELVRSLMPGPAIVIEPAIVFLNYVSASSCETIWYDYDDEGALAIERARAMLALYEEYIRKNLEERFKNNKIPEAIVQLLREKFNMQL
jgi:hypothetical protein